jgi:D-inositol-3-phosphate glycosyltransferase
MRQPTRPLRVVLTHRLLADRPVGGVSTVYRSLAHELAGSGVDVATMSPNPCRWSPHHIIVPDSAEPAEYARGVAAAVRAFAPDVAECSSWEYELLEYVRQPRSGRAAVVVRCEFAAPEIRAFHLRAGEGELVTRADRLIPVSEVAGASMRSHYGSLPDQVVIRNGVDRSVMRPGPRYPADRLAAVLRRSALSLAADGSTAPLPDTEAAYRVARLLADPRPLLLWVGKVTFMKGWPEFQRLVAELAGAARFLVVLGHAPAFYRADLAPDANLLVVQDIPQEDLPAVYRAADWLLSTSRAEGYGLAIAEAVCCGVPALVPARLGVVWEFLTPGVDAVGYADAADIRALLRKPPPRPTALGIDDWSVCAGRTIDVFEALAGAGSRGGRP